MGLTVPFGGGQPLEAAWPEILDRRDVHAGDELQLLPGCWESHRDFAVAAKLDPVAWRVLDDEFRRLFPLVLCGRSEPAALQAVADQMGLTAPIRHDRRPAAGLGVPVDDAMLADIAENYVPEIAELAGDRVLGPFADLRLPRRVRAVAAGVMAFTRLVPPAVRPIDRYADDKPRPTVALRASIRAVAMSPPMLWHTDGMRPLLPLARSFWIAGPVPVDAPAVLGRLVATDGGPQLFCALPLPIVPTPEPLMRRLTWELWRVRRHELRVTWEDLLRERGEVLYRSALEQVWERCASLEGDDRWGW